MNFEPVSSRPYTLFNPTGQILVCTNMAPAETARTVWGERAAAAFSFEWKDPLEPVVRDILANPQIRAVILATPTPPHRGPGSRVLREFWESPHPRPDWKIPTIYLDLIRRFVDLFDEDCGIYGPLPPFWPERIHARAAASAPADPQEDRRGNPRGATP